MKSMDTISDINNGSILKCLQAYLARFIVFFSKIWSVYIFFQHILVEGNSLSHIEGFKFDGGEDLGGQRVLLKALGVH